MKTPRTVLLSHFSGRLAAALVVFITFAVSFHAAAVVKPNVTLILAGDRGLPINQTYPDDVFYHNGKGGRVLDVTKPPFNAKGDGVTDDTKALCAAMRFVADNYQPLVGEGWSYCGSKLNHSWIIYLPEGEYVVSDTVCQGWPERVFNHKDGWGKINRLVLKSPEDGKKRAADVYAAENYGIRIVGQSRDGTVIRLKDASPGFGVGEAKAVISFYMRTWSNVNQGNYMRNATIVTGKGNPGAVGLKWNASNWGGIGNVAIRSGDGQGRAGLMMNRSNAHGYLHDLVVDGFDVGVDLSAGSASMVVLEHATLANQREIAVRVGYSGFRDCLSARKIQIENAPIAFKAGEGSHVVLLDTRAVARGANNPALIVEKGGHLFARDIALSGYSNAVVKAGEVARQGEFIDEYVSDEPVSLHRSVPARSLRLPVKDAPIIPTEVNLRKWAGVHEFGAVGDGITDDTAAVQRAMNSGKPVVYFPKANYVINGTVAIPATVREVSFLWASVHRSEPAPEPGQSQQEANASWTKVDASAAAKPALFRVAQPSQEPLLIHDNVNAGGVFLDHDADRPVILEDVETWFHHARSYARGPDMLFPSPAAQKTDIWQLYRNTRPNGAVKEVFASNVMGFAVGGSEARHAVNNVRAWVRQLNNEHQPYAQIAFRHSDAWVLGFKSESAEVLYHVGQSSRLEVLGGTYLNFDRRENTPMVISGDSLVSLLLAIWGSGVHHSTVLRDETKGTATVAITQFPKMGTRENEIVIPLLVNFPK